jgi:hypothetical protein
VQAAKHVDWEDEGGTSTIRPHRGQKGGSTLIIDRRQSGHIIKSTFPHSTHRGGKKRSNSANAPIFNCSRNTK